MHFITKFSLPLLFVFLFQNLYAQPKKYSYLRRAFERDTSITLLSDGVAQITISSYNFKVDNQFVEAILISPSKCVFKFPAIILLPGFKQNAKDFIPIGIGLAQEGFVCMAISQPGSGRSEGNPDYAGPKTISSITTGYIKLQQETFVNPDKIHYHPTLTKNISKVPLKS